MKKACADLNVDQASIFRAALDPGGSGKMFKLGVTLRAAMAASLGGTVAAEVIATHIPNGPRRTALAHAKLVDAELQPTEEAGKSLADMQAKLDYLATQQNADTDAAARYAEWAAEREEETLMAAAQALRDLEEEFGEEEEEESSRMTD